MSTRLRESNHCHSQPVDTTAVSSTVTSKFPRPSLLRCGLKKAGMVLNSRAVRHEQVSECNNRRHNTVHRLDCACIGIIERISNTEPHGLERAAAQPSRSSEGGAYVPVALCSSCLRSAIASSDALVNIGSTEPKDDETALLPPSPLDERGSLQNKLLRLCTAHSCNDCTS